MSDMATWALANGNPADFDQVKQAINDLADQQIRDGGPEGWETGRALQTLLESLASIAEIESVESDLYGCAEQYEDGHELTQGFTDAVSDMRATIKTSLENLKGDVSADEKYLIKMLDQLETGLLEALETLETTHEETLDEHEQELKTFSSDMKLILDRL